jgi:hypothetical protein
MLQQAHPASHRTARSGWAFFIKLIKMSKQKFGKPPKSYSDLLELLSTRGLTIENKEKNPSLIKKRRIL